MTGAEHQARKSRFSPRFSRFFGVATGGPTLARVAMVETANEEAGRVREGHGARRAASCAEGPRLAASHTTAPGSISRSAQRLAKPPNLDALKLGCRPIAVPAGFPLPFATTRPLGIVLLGLSLTYLVMTAWWSRPIHIRGVELQLPGMGTTTLQVAIASIDVTVAGRNVHASAKRDGQMRIIAADAGALTKGLQRRPIGPRLLVVEAEMLVDEVADRLDSRPAGGCRIKQMSRRGLSVRCLPRSSDWPAGTAGLRSVNPARCAAVHSRPARSGCPLSWIVASLRSTTRPEGTNRRPQRLPKESTNSEMGTRGSTSKRSGVWIVETRDGCT